MKKILALIMVLTCGFLCFGQDTKFSTLMEKAKKYEQDKKMVYAIGTYLDAYAAGKTLEEKKLAYNSYFTIADAVAFGKPGLDEYDEFSLHDEWIKLLEDFDAYWLAIFPKTVFINNFEWKEVDLKNRTQKMLVGISMPDSKKYSLMCDIVKHGLRNCDTSFWEGGKGPVHFNYYGEKVSWDDRKYFSKVYMADFEFLDENGKKLFTSTSPLEYDEFNSETGKFSDISGTYRTAFVDIPADYIDLITKVHIKKLYAAVEVKRGKYTQNRELKLFYTEDEPNYAQLQPEEIKEILANCSLYEAMERLMVSIPGRDFDVLATDLGYLVKKSKLEEKEVEAFCKNVNDIVGIKEDTNYRKPDNVYNRKISDFIDEIKEYDVTYQGKERFANSQDYGRYTDFTAYYRNSYGCKNREHEAAIKNPNLLGLYDLTDGDYYYWGNPYESEMKKNHAYRAEVKFEYCNNTRIVRNRISEEEKQSRIEKLKKIGDAQVAVEKNQAAIEAFLKGCKDNTQEVPTYYINAEYCSLLVDYLNTHGGTNPYVQIVIQGNIKSFEEISSAIRNSKFWICLYLYTDSNPVEIDSFNNCLALARIILPENIKLIKKNTFNGCKNLQEIGGLTSNITKIEENAFVDCDSIKTIGVKSTEKQWKKVKIDKKGNQSFLNSKVEYY